MSNTFISTVFQALKYVPAYFKNLQYGVSRHFPQSVFVSRSESPSLKPLLLRFHKSPPMAQLVLSREINNRAFKETADQRRSYRVTSEPVPPQLQIKLATRRKVLSGERKSPEPQTWKPAGFCCTPSTETHTRFSSSLKAQ